MVMMAQGITITHRKRERVMNKWTVWVGGSEMSSNLLSHSQALKIVKVWKDLGYDDVVVEEVA
jgi:hypothetical protein